VTAPSEGPAGDMRPARVALDFDVILDGLGVEGRVAVDSIHMVEYDAGGQPAPYPDYRSQASLEVPCRFDNAQLRQYSYMYNLFSDCPRGDLVWTHCSRGGESSRYAVYFDVARPDVTPRALPRPLIGDEDILYQREGGALSSIYHTRPAVGDWDGDGLADLILGNILGHVFFYSNIGQAGHPAFGPGRLIEADGNVIDVGWYAAPDLVDWDGDGDLDVVTGADGGQVLWFENTGGATSPALAVRGRITADGAAIQSPHEPCPETPFMRVDYVPVPDAVDWDGDGDLDLLVGGYLTGRVYFYENVRNGSGPPDLTARGLLTSEGEPIDVCWGAAPCAADLDADGDLDLVVGTLDQRLDTANAAPWPSFFYFSNEGTPTEPRLVRRAFPLDADVGTLTIPRAVDWDADGDLDLITGIGTVMRLMRNIGGPEKMSFHAEPPLEAPWMPRVTSGFAVPPVDWDNDGDVDLILSGCRTATLLENIRPGNTPDFVVRGEVTAGGEVIAHDWPLGDNHSFAEPFDWDLDGDPDYLLGNSAGAVWLYENVGSSKAWNLAAGVRLVLATGEPLHVGKPLDTAMTDFATHSGNRSDPGPGDFDGDGDHDLVVSDAYGGVTYFENTGSNAAPSFAAGKKVLEGEGRCVVAVTDWDEDGRLDVIASWAGGGMWLCRNVATAAVPEFEKTRAFDLPWIPYPHPYAIDWNRDGDVDLLMASSYAFLFFADRDFLEGGYAEGEFIDAEPVP